jgi:ribosomal protein L39E
MATSLHQQLKCYYVADETRHEVDLDSYRIDAIDDQGRLIEIQCASLLAIRDKIRKLTKTHKVVLVKPLATRKKLLKKKRRNGEVVSRRYSPVKQTLPWIFEELVHLAKVFPHPNLQLDVLLTEQEEIRIPPQRRVWRRKHSVQDRVLVEVQETISLTSADDLWKRLNVKVPNVFTTADLATAANMPRWLAQKAAYCFREMGLILNCGKQGNAIEYRLRQKQSDRKKKAA